MTKPVMSPLEEESKKYPQHETRLVISKAGFPKFSARGCTQTLTTLPRGHFHRTVNGTLVYLGMEGQDKWQSTIKGQDTRPAAMGALKPGDKVHVQCIQPLCQPWAWQKSPVLTLKRPTDSATVRCFDAYDKPCPVTIKDQEVSLSSRPETCLVYVFYRPQLWMRVISLHYTTHEWDTPHPWTLVLEEV